MLRVALTGGIASGKSYVLARLAAKGVPTVDADTVAHQALAAGSPLVSRITARFGRRILGADGSVDRRALGALVFANPKARTDLEAILHPEIFRRIDEWFTVLPESDLAVADIPLLFETHHEGLFDRVIVTTCSPARQIERLKERNGLTEEEARQRLQTQWPIEEKARRAHYLIETSGTFEETDKQVDRVFAALTSEATHRR